MINFEKIAEEFRLVLQKHPLTDINVVVREKEIFVSAKPSRPEEELWRRLGIHVRGE